MIRIFLIGFMGCGKTTLGRAYAKEMGLSFVDLDWYIEERFHTSIQQIFSERGEEAFRKIEQRMLHEVAEFENVVIACGGGTPCFYDNMVYMNLQGTTVFLDTSMSTLLRRLKLAQSSRPLLAGKTEEELLQYILTTLEKRMPYYKQVKLKINADYLESRKQIATAVATLKNALEQ